MTLPRVLICSQVIMAKHQFCRRCIDVQKLGLISSMFWTNTQTFASSNALAKGQVSQSVRFKSNRGSQPKTLKNQRTSKTKAENTIENDCNTVHKSNTTISRKKKSKEKMTLNSLLKPVDIHPDENSPDVDVGKELTGNLDKAKLLSVMTEFYRKEEVKMLAAENGLDSELFHKVFVSFRRYCKESVNLPVELHIILSDIILGYGHVEDLMPYFLSHARHMYPHLDCKDDLEKISDLRLPANWYPDARNIKRKIVYHAGPTNSGKTYHALKSFFEAESGVYCGPLRMLANEISYKSNSAGTPCDLVTGEERKHVGKEGEPASHVSCTVEMTSTNTPYGVAVIDEIQMIRDPQRGWAWTRALLGVCAEEVHVCGEASAIDFVREIVLDTGDDLEINDYQRLTKLKVLSAGLDDIQNVKPGDCIVCFSKSDIYNVSRQLERNGFEVAVIYGTLPPGAKLYQAKRFNDPNEACNVMVATDAIGMGLNLNIRRVVFYSLYKPVMTESGSLSTSVIAPSTALQIAGRAGRYGTKHETGEVTTFKSSDLGTLKELLSQDIPPVQQAGLHPTADQVELFSYHLPKASLSNIIDLFVLFSKLDNDRYFMCNLDSFKFLADLIDHINLPLRSRYVFCCAPIPKQQTFVCALFVKFVRMFSEERPMTFEWVCSVVGWPFEAPKIISQLTHLEAVFDVLDIYLWLSYRFPDVFPDVDAVREMQQELEDMIRKGVANITELVRNSEEETRKVKTVGSPVTTETNELESVASDEDLPLSEKLVKQGVISYQVLEKLKEEMNKDRKRRQEQLNSESDSKR